MFTRIRQDYSEDNALYACIFFMDISLDFQPIWICSLNSYLPQKLWMSFPYPMGYIGIPWDIQLFFGSTFGLDQLESWQCFGQSHNSSGLFLLYAAVQGTKEAAVFQYLLFTASLRYPVLEWLARARTAETYLTADFTPFLDLIDSC